MRTTSKLSIAMGTIVGLLLITPFIMGILVKNEFYNLISDFNIPGQFEIQVLEYSQGWFSSNADVQYTIKADKGSGLDATPMPPFQFVLREKIHHGPIIYLKDHKEQKLHFAQAVFESTFDDKQYPLLAHTIIHLDGNITTTLQADKISNAVEQMDGVSFVFQKIDGTFNISPKQQDAQGRLALGTIDLLMNKSQLRIKNIGLDYKLNKGEDEIWEGKRNITVGNLFLDTPENHQIILQGFTFDLFNDIKNDTMHAGVNFQIDSVQMNGKNYGQQDIKFTFNDLNVRSLSDIQKHSQTISRQNIPLPILATQFYQLTMNLLSKGLSFDLNRFDLNTSWGEVRAKANLKLHPSTETIYSPLQLLDQLSATAHFQLPKSLFEELIQNYHMPQTSETEDKPTKSAKEKIKEWVDAGWLNLNGNNIKFKIKYENKELFINDKTISADEASLLSGKLFSDVLAMNIVS